MAARLKGQEVNIRTLVDDNLVSELTSITSFNDEISQEIKEDGFLGDKVNRFDYVLNGFGGDFEFQIDKGSWYNFTEEIMAKARRETPETVFNIIITEEYTDGTTNVITYQNVSWGPIPKTIGARGDFVKVKMTFKTSDRDAQVDAL